MSDVPHYFADAVPAHLVPWDQLTEDRRQESPPPVPAGYLLVELFDSRRMARPAIATPAYRGRSGDCPGDRRAAGLWAKEVLTDPCTVLLDIEATDFDGRLIEIALLRPDGELLLDTLVNPGDVVIADEAAAKHGITVSMLQADGVPTFAELYDDLVDLLTGARIICWNSAFDRGLMTLEADLLLPHYYTNAAETEWVAARWEDAMAQHAAWVGEPSVTGTGYRPHRLNGPHRALGDCETMIDRLTEMAANPYPRPGTVRGNWSAADKAEVASLFDHGNAPDEIAEITGRTLDSVTWQLYQLGRLLFPSHLVRQPSGQAAPKPPQAYTMDDLRREHPNSHKRWTPEEEVRLMTRHAEGATVQDLISEFGRNYNAITIRLAQSRQGDASEPPV
ncbi:3'-5' exonuclease [Kribbella sp. NPDC056345]|uniref:3'-5' exonuclease n=1 Tax=Kribbella sp. NPDC056345 TaxID=3345789 RepID=UPI0035D728FF